LLMTTEDHAYRSAGHSPVGIEAHAVAPKHCGDERDESGRDNGNARSPPHRLRPWPNAIAEVARTDYRQHAVTYEGCQQKPD